MSSVKPKLWQETLILNVSGSGNLKIELDASGDVEGDVSGSGDLYLKGKCKKF